MLRLLNVIAIVALVGSAVYAYSIKYATLYRVERMVKLKHELQSERDSLAMLRAEWAHIANPVRIEALGDKYLGTQTMALTQISTLAGLPDKAARGDQIGAKLEDLGMSEPKAAPKAAAVNPPPVATLPAPRKTPPQARSTTLTGR